jgi:hypothetical protein
MPVKKTTKKCKAVGLLIIVIPKNILQIVLIMELHVV